MFSKFWHREKDNIIPILLFLSTIVMGIMSQYAGASFLIYLFPIPLYFLMQRINIWQAITYGANYGLYFGFSAHLYLSKFERFDPFLFAWLLIKVPLQAMQMRMQKSARTLFSDTSASNSELRKKSAEKKGCTQAVPTGTGQNAQTC